MTVPAPNPGSPEAVTQGCVCPALDNHNGVRAPSGGWWVNADCPLHDPWPPDHDRGEAGADSYRAALAQEVEKVERTDLKVRAAQELLDEVVASIAVRVGLAHGCGAVEKREERP